MGRKSNFQILETNFANNRQELEKTLINFL